MFKRVLLVSTIVAAFGAVSFTAVGQASAHNCDYGGYGYRAAYYPGYAPYYAAPRTVYYPGSYAAFRPVIADDHHHSHHHHDHRGGVTLTFGF